MTEERRREIALKIVEQQTMEKGIPGGDTLKRDMGNLAPKIGIPVEELMSFYQTFAPKVLGGIFGYNEVSVDMKGPRKKFQING